MENTTAKVNDRRTKVLDDDITHVMVDNVHEVSTAWL